MIDIQAGGHSSNLETFHPEHAKRYQTRDRPSDEKKGPAKKPKRTDVIGVSLKKICISPTTEAESEKSEGGEKSQEEVSRKRGH